MKRLAKPVFRWYNKMQKEATAPKYKEMEESICRWT